MSDGQGRRRVVITGIGAVTPCGLDAEQTWRSVREGRSGVSAVEGFEGHVRIAAQVKDFEPERYMEHRSVRKTDRFAQFAVAAATMAVEDAGIDIRADARADRLLDRHRHRRPQDRGDRAPQAVRGRPRPPQPVLGDGPDPEHGRRRDIDGAGHPRPAHHRVHRLRRVGHVDRKRARCSSAPAWPTRCWRAAWRRRWCRSDSAASARCGRCRAETTTRRAPAGRSTWAATGSSWPRAAPCWCSRSWSGRVPAAPASTPRSWATACRRTRTMSPSRIRSAAIRRGRCETPWSTAG